MNTINDSHFYIAKYHEEDAESKICGFGFFGVKDPTIQDVLAHPDTERYSVVIKNGCSRAMLVARLRAMAIAIEAGTPQGEAWSKECQDLDLAEAREHGKLIGLRT